MVGRRSSLYRLDESEGSADVGWRATFATPSAVHDDDIPEFVSGPLALIRKAEPEGASRTVTMTAGRGHGRLASEPILGADICVVGHACGADGAITGKDRWSREDRGRD